MKAIFNVSARKKVSDAVEAKTAISIGEDELVTLAIASNDGPEASLTMSPDAARLLAEKLTRLANMASMS